MLDPVAELCEHRARHVRRVLRYEEDADSLGPDHPNGPLHGLEKGTGGVSEEEVRLVEEKDELWLVQIPHLRQLVEELGEQPHEHRGEQPWLLLDGGELQARDHGARVVCRPQQVTDLERGLTEELRSAAVL